MSGPNKQYDPVEVAALAPAQIESDLAAALEAIAAAQDLDELKAARQAHASDKSALALANREIAALPPSAKAEAGKRVGQARGKVGAALKARQQELEDERDERILVEERIDVSVLSPYRRLGARHPISLATERVQDIFVGMGWEIADGPEIEAEWFNFDALNFAPDHPARQMQDTFFIDPPGSGLVLRTHTSPVQARTMLHLDSSLLKRDLPIYVAVPGRVYRTDELDATHTPVFHQVEGLAVDKGLTMAHLQGTLDHLVKALFGAEARTRLRPSFFPFTEPSAEMDLWFPQKRGGAGWIEWGGCGMVNRNVLLACGVDPDVYSGFAFGMGIDRTVMLRNDVRDMHDLVEGDVRFSAQFGMEI
ncbi:phenylalanine--tRNA ligase subunit alpha [Austwickia chelonae]|uniref:Phenylalanine--tRNA ligase alpha subunit n=1 Tax=Austwickia chelonae NBRC 105200 TaxID=1184607 RepID=K6VI74_9MICO|nr:phenylalanine--tRNA ligase subunit alpha [Austwickia chelonae]GAB76449.1 phenylalanyl-tRNA synthetase alpha chain [Austwickia chelonae NBRC 105200]